jgi:hypothetical protein
VELIERLELTCDGGRKWERGRRGVYIPAELNSKQGISSPFTASCAGSFWDSPFSTHHSAALKLCASPTRVSHQTIHSSQSWSFSGQKGPIDPTSCSAKSVQAVHQQTQLRLAPPSSHAALTPRLQSPRSLINQLHLILLKLVSSERLLTSLALSFVPLSPANTTLLANCKQKEGILIAWVRTPELQ